MALSQTIALPKLLLICPRTKALQWSFRLSLPLQGSLDSLQHAPLAGSPDPETFDDSLHVARTHAAQMGPRSPFRGRANSCSVVGFSALDPPPVLTVQLFHATNPTIIIGRFDLHVTQNLWMGQNQKGFIPDRLQAGLGNRFGLQHPIL